MNKPRRVVRHSIELEIDPALRMGDGTFASGITNENYAKLFADIVTQFNQLETMMP